MKFKLNMKIQLLFMIMIFCFFISIFSSLVVSHQKFKEYVDQRESEMMVALADSAANFYSEYGGWSFLIGNRDLWISFLKGGFENRASQNESLTPRYEPIILTMTYQNIGAPMWDPLNLGPSICLFDKDKKYVINLHSKERSIEECTTFPIELEGTTVGWLGLIDNERIIEPHDKMFRQTQLTIFFMLSVALLVIMIIMNIIFKKQIVSPITKLASAIKKLGDRNFRFHIPIESSDEIGELTECFNNMTDRLELYERNQKQWMSDISHELRTPLSAMMCEIEAVRDRILKPNEELFTSISDEIKSLIKLVNEISDISLIDSGNFQIQNEIVNLFSILNQKTNTFKTTFKSNDMSLDFDFEPAAIELQIMGDPYRLQQLVSNILDNVIRHAKKPGWLKIRQTHDIDNIKIIFEDSGPGVPNYALPLIFNRLYKGDPSRNRERGGNGLGLAICKSIVEMHNGKIQAQNTKGGGFMIEVLLPMGNNADNNIKNN